MDRPACESCKIIFIGTDSIFATICGHLFHEICLDKIYSGAKCCPQCKIMCLQSESLRVFLPFPEETSAKESLVTKCNILKRDLAEVQNEVVHARASQVDLDDFIENKTATVNQRNRKLSKLKALGKEKENLQNKIKDLEKVYAVQKALAGNSNDQMITEKPSPDMLATVAVVLQREIKRATAEKTEMRSEMIDSRKENEALAKTYRKRREKFEILVARTIQRGGQNQ